MQQAVSDLVMRRYGARAEGIKPLGGGFYGRVFLARIPMPPYDVVVKLYLFPGLAKREAMQLDALRQHALVPMPRVYFTEEAVEGRGHDALAMEYLPGVNAGSLKELPPNHEAIAVQIVDNLLSYHSAVHTPGFGELDAASFHQDWRQWYHPMARSAVQKAEDLAQRQELDGGTLEIMKQALDRYDRIFYLPITDARLVHGDYNTWNVQLTQDLSRVASVIDPFGCRWADRELDLYQLDNANGRAFGLLDLYASRQALSENFPVKRAFYELFTELHHFYDAKVTLSKSSIPSQAQELRRQMHLYGVL